ncbi:MAG: hypothetical protein ACREGA_01515 [Candidatus Saccharimonadales bacterium]
MPKQNILHLNGKNYELASGQVVLNDPIRHASTRHNKIPKNPEPKPTKQDLARQANRAQTAAPALQAIKQPKPPAGQKPHTAAPPAARHQPERGQTLMRRGLNKPGYNHGSIRRIKSRAGSLPTRQSLAKLPAKRASIDKSRYDRAKKTAQHHQVKHFDLNMSSAKLLTTSAQPARHSLATNPNLSLNGGAVAQTAPSQLENLIASALERADSHRQPVPKIHRRHKISKLHMAVAGLALLLIIGFASYRELPNIELHVAASRSGVPAKLPSHTPSGFAFAGPINYQPGAVQVSYYSGNQHFSLLQKTSSWSDASLRQAAFSSSAGSALQTMHTGGRTIYLLDSGNATWLNHNVWYQLTGNANLSRQQIAGIVDSI